MRHRAGYEESYKHFDVKHNSVRDEVIDGKGDFDGMVFPGHRETACAGDDVSYA